MRGSINFTRLLIALLLLTAIVLVGCDEKKSKTEEIKNTVKKLDVEKDKTVSPKDITTIKKPVVVTRIPDITGNWAGTFDGRSAKLIITEQSDSSFSGKITINYRQQIKQVVKGSFSPTTLNMFMADQTHSRYRGKYNGTLSNDASGYSGSFIMDVDGSKLPFNFKKK